MIIKGRMQFNDVGEKYNPAEECSGGGLGSVVTIRCLTVTTN